MAYTSDIAELLATQLDRFVTLNPHQLAGHVANLDFWEAEVRHCLDVIDGYGSRFNRMKAAQTTHVAEHQTVEFSLSDPCCMREPPAPPRRIPRGELERPRQHLIVSMRRFLARCHSAGLIDAASMQRSCERLGIVAD